MEVEMNVWISPQRIQEFKENQRLHWESLCHKMREYRRNEYILRFLEHGRTEMI